MNALVADAIDMLRRQGLAAAVEQSAHIKIRFKNALGSQCCLIVSRTPSNRTAIQKNRAELRRLLRRPAR
jgi:hypothetical protein